MGVVSVWRAERYYLPDGRLHLAVRAVVIDQVGLWSSSILPSTLTEMTCYNPQPYRDKAGLIVRGFITLRLADFLPHQLAVGVPGTDGEITIPNSVLKEALDTAEVFLTATISGYWAEVPLAGVVVESDSSPGSPPDEINSSDESIWERLEALDQRKTLVTSTLRMNDQDKYLYYREVHRLVDLTLISHALFLSLFHAFMTYKSLSLLLHCSQFDDVSQPRHASLYKGR